jgi:hypothetical protein
VLVQGQGRHVCVASGQSCTLWQHDEHALMSIFKQDVLDWHQYLQDRARLSVEEGQLAST